MKKVVPSYYKNFHCIADKCKHSCCIGWEIDIDDKTKSVYESVPGDFGIRLKNSINTENGVSCFALAENDRCPFLNEKGLCDIILNIGEEHLSQICTDHPRFRNYFSDREELGLGLCCEEACRLILSNEEKTELEVIDDLNSDEEFNEFEIFILDFRNKLFSIVQNRTYSISDRILFILELLDVELTQDLIKKCIDSFLNMEIMYDDWKYLLYRIDNNFLDNNFDSEFEIAFEQILVYFIYRHVSNAENVTDVVVRSLFSVLSVKIICCIFNMEKGNDSIDRFSLLCNICRLYSSEIEYCEDNTETVLDLISDFIM